MSIDHGESNFTSSPHTHERFLLYASHIFQTFIYIHNKASLLDTRESLLGYQKTRPPPGTTFPRKTYELTSEENLNNYWEDLQIVGLGSNMGFKSGMHVFFSTLKILSFGTDRHGQTVQTQIRLLGTV